MLDLNKVELEFQVQGGGGGRVRVPTEFNSLTVHVAAAWWHLHRSSEHLIFYLTPKSEREELAKLPLVTWEQEHHGYAIFAGAIVH